MMQGNTYKLNFVIILTKKLNRQNKMKNKKKFSLFD